MSLPASILPWKTSGAAKAGAEETVMIGDWPDRDIVGAKKVGLKTVWASYGDTFGTKPKESGADYEIKDIIELVDIIKKENGTS